jgi:hypothetical protein
VSETKSEKAIANDIIRRLLPDCEKVFKLVNERISAENAHLDGKAVMLDRVAKIFNTEPDVRYNSKETTGEVEPYKGLGLKSFGPYGYGKIVVNSADSISIKLESISGAVALRILPEIARVLKESKTS